MYTEDSPHILPKAKQKRHDIQCSWNITKVGVKHQSINQSINSKTKLGKLIRIKRNICGEIWGNLRKKNIPYIFL